MADQKFQKIRQIHLFVRVTSLDPGGHCGPWASSPISLEGPGTNLVSLPPPTYPHFESALGDQSEK